MKYKTSATNYPYIQVRVKKEDGKKEYEATQEISQNWAMKMAEILVNDPLSSNIDKWCQAMYIPMPNKGQALTAEEAETKINILNKRLYKVLRKIVKIKENFKKNQ